MNESGDIMRTADDSESELSFLYQSGNLPLFETVEHLRWKVLVDCHGEKIGTIENVEEIEDIGRVEFLQIGRGGFLGFGAERFLVPVTTIVEVEEKTVKIGHPLAALAEVPQFDHERLGEAAYAQEVRSWWSQPVVIVVETTVPSDSATTAITTDLSPDLDNFSQDLIA